jgi:hypothetical protein
VETLSQSLHKHTYLAAGDRSRELHRQERSFYTRTASTESGGQSRRVSCDTIRTRQEQTHHPCQRLSHASPDQLGRGPLQDIESQSSSQEDHPRRRRAEQREVLSSQKEVRPPMQPFFLTGLASHSVASQKALTSDNLSLMCHLFGVACLFFSVAKSSVLLALSIHSQLRYWGTRNMPWTAKDMP